MVIAVAHQVTGPVSDAGLHVRQLARAVRCHDTQVKIDQHGRRRCMRVVASGAGCARLLHVLSMFEAAVLHDAALNVVALVAQSVVVGRVRNP